jgi:hypothetical protein
MKLKNRKLLLIPVAVVAIFLFLWTYFFWYPDFVMDQRIEELKKDGVDVQTVVYDIFYADMTASSPETIFAEKLYWSAFKQDVMTAKADFGSVTVFVDREARTFAFSWNETTYYYYQAT